MNCADKMEVTIQAVINNRIFFIMKKIKVVEQKKFDLLTKTGKEILLSENLGLLNQCGN